ncbi:unnamed protein product [Calypogeia fissa]
MDPGIAGGQATGPGQPPGTDMTSISFRDQLWLNSFPLDCALVFDYFALSPFYDRTCSNEQLRLRSIHPLDAASLKSMTGIEYILHEAQEPHLFVIRKQKRDGPEKVTLLSAYYVLDGSIYQAPQLYSVVSSRAARALYHISKAFSQAASKLERLGHDAESETTKSKSEDPKADDTSQKKVTEKALDVKEALRIDQILAGVFRRLPAAPPPPPFPVVAPPAEAAQPPGQQGQLPADGTGGVASDLGPPSKRVKTERQ